MNVLFLVPVLRAGGGLGRSTVELIAALRALGVETSVTCLWDTQASLSAELEAQGVGVRVLPEGDLKGKMFALRRAIQAEGVSLVHTSRTLPSTIARLASVGLHTPVVSSIINVPEPVGRRKHAMAYRWTNRLTDRFHAISNATKAHAVRDLGIPEERITVIERGRDLGRLGTPGTERRARARAALGIGAGVPVILTAGRQDPQKDQVTLLAAFDRVAMDHPDALLLVAGRKGSSTPVLEAEQARMRHADRVRMLGHRDDVPELMAAADVFAFPSAWEGLGGAAIEAMALGLPVVASDIPALHEVVAEGVTGLFVPSKQPVMLARALSSLLDDPQRARGLGAAGLRVFMDRFTIERSAQRMRDLYMELLRGRKPVAEAA